MYNYLPKKKKNRTFAFVFLCSLKDFFDYIWWHVKTWYFSTWEKFSFFKNRMWHFFICSFCRYISSVSSCEQKICKFGIPSGDRVLSLWELTKISQVILKKKIKIFATVMLFIEFWVLTKRTCTSVHKKVFWTFVFVLMLTKKLILKIQWKITWFFWKINIVQ